MEESKPFSLNAIDWMKVVKGAQVAFAGFALTVIPMLFGFKYVWFDVDCTPFVVAVLSVVANIIRKFVSDNSK